MRCLTLLLMAAGLLAQEDPALRVQRWRADLEAFAYHLEAEHPLPFLRLPRSDFERRLRELEDALPALEDPVIAARWAALVAALGEEHTEVGFEPELETRHLPIRIATFRDGVFIVEAARPYGHLLGARIDRVEGLPLDRIYEGLKPFVPFSQEGWYRYTFDEAFGDWPALLEAGGLLKPGGSWLVQGRDRQGRTFSEPLPLLDGEAAARLRWTREKGRQDPGAPYSYRLLGRRRVLLVRLAECREDPDRPFRAFLRRALGAYRRLRPSRLVVDLRGNTGGSDGLVEELVEALRREPSLNGHLDALIDGGVFSAGAVAAWRLRHDLGARLIGGPCGASANHIGAVETVELPSGRKASFGTEVHLIDREHPRDFATPILPDVAVQESHAAWEGGRDEVLEAALGTGTGTPR